MGYFESWKELILRPDAQIKKRKFGQDFGRTLAMQLVISLTGAISFLFSSMRNPLQDKIFSQFFTLQADPLIRSIVMFVAVLLFSFAMFFVSYGLQHLLARLFGGKGSYRELLGFVAEVYFPLSLLTLLTVIPCVGLMAGVAIALVSIWTIFLLYKFLHLDNTVFHSKKN